MARLIPLILILVGLLIFVIARQQSTRARSDRVHRPRGARRDSAGERRAGAGGGTNWIVRHADLTGIRDAYSSAAIDPQSPLWRCGGCLAYYHRPSIDALRSQNGARCALCGSDDLRPVSVA